LATVDGSALNTAVENSPNADHSTILLQAAESLMPLEIHSTESGSDMNEIVKNARRCDICGCASDKHPYGFGCQSNPCHMADLNVGIFIDLTPPKVAEQKEGGVIVGTPETDELEIVLGLGQYAERATLCVTRLIGEKLRLESHLQECRELLRDIDGEGRLDGFTGAFKKQLRRQVAQLNTEHRKEKP